jgi:hypothetical protein
MQGTGLASAAVLAPSWRRDMTEEVPANTICAVTAEAARNVRFDHGGRLPTRLNQPGAPKRPDNQLHRARVLEVRIQSPPAESRLRTRFLQRRVRGLHDLPTFDSLKHSPDFYE